MRVPLILHPDSTCDPVRALYVEVQRLAPRRLIARYVLEGDIGHIRFGWHVHRQRRDELWRRTCFEAFIQVEGQSDYLEFNLSTEGWNCYHFDEDREGMTEAKIAEPQIETSRQEKPVPPGTRAHMTDLDTLDAYQAPFLMLQAHLELERRAELWLDRPWHLGLSAVIEENTGRKSYWALKHPDGPPDFHRADCFTLELPAARPA